MKLPSAKSILRTYKKSGKVFDKKKAINRRVKAAKTNLTDTDHQTSNSESKEKSLSEAIEIRENIIEN
jgi:hypothetical protein